jgi:hypothetical protein
MNADNYLWFYNYLNDTANIKYLQIFKSETIPIMKITSSRNAMYHCGDTVRITDTVTNKDTLFGVRFVESKITTAGNDSLIDTIDNLKKPYSLNIPLGTSPLGIY